MGFVSIYFLLTGETVLAFCALILLRIDVMDAEIRELRSTLTLIGQLVAHDFIDKEKEDK